MTASVVGYHEGTCERASSSQPQILVSQRNSR